MKMFHVKHWDFVDRRTLDNVSCETLKRHI